MPEYIRGINPVLLAFLATVFTWLLTALGAAFVFFRKQPSRKIFDCSLGFAGGIMTSASFFSLLLPAIEIVPDVSFLPPWIVISVGFIAGCICLYELDRVIPHLHINAPVEEKEGKGAETSLPYLLVLAITLHNVPEGIAVGVAFGTLKYGIGEETFLTALSLAFAIGL